MSLHPSVRQSFLIRFLLYTAIAGNVYVALQALIHTFGIDALDRYVRWYAFKAFAAWNLVLLAGACLTLLGAFKILRAGKAGYKMYLAGKLITCLGYVILTLLEYHISQLPYPYVLLPVLVGISSIYPMLLYISLRKSYAKAGL
jgi:hypothetical protein